MGSRLSAVLSQMTAAVTVEVSYSTFSRLAKDKEKLIDAYYNSIEFSAALGLPLFVALASMAPEITHIVYGANGIGSGQILMPIALFNGFQLMIFYNYSLLQAIGRPELVNRLLLLNAALSATALILSYGQSLIVTTIAFVVAQVIAAPFAFLLARRYLGYSFSRVARLTYPFFVGGAAMFAMSFLIRWGLPDFQERFVGIRLAILAVALGLTYLAVVAMIDMLGLKRVVRAILSRRAS
jgi:O-antigen/teichoic acid export membrane protein